MNTSQKGSKNYNEYDLLLKYEAASKIENILLWLRWPLIILFVIWPFQSWPIKYTIVIFILYTITVLFAGQITVMRLVALDKFREKQYWNSIKKEKNEKDYSH